MTPPALDPDSLLNEYLAETTPALQEKLLFELVFLRSEPIIRGIVRKRLGTAAFRDGDDVTSEVIVDLISRLHALKQDGTGNPITRYGAYVTASTHHGCDRYFRVRYPQRHRLKNRLRYTLDNLTGYATWSGSHGVLVCGRTLWQDRPTVPIAPDLVIQSIPRNLSPASTATAVFDLSEGPVEFNDFVECLAALWGIKDVAVPSELVEDSAPSAEAQIDVVLENRQAAQKLWTEVVQLPLNQRIALLLNLRDARGGPALGLIPAAGLASIRQIAGLLEIPAGEFAGLWPRLPLSDLDIAERLSLDRQQVINLRKAARQRLVRRLERKIG